jgi:hypothetical protein
MPTGSSINSVINLNIPATVPDAFENPEVRAAVELFLNTLNNLLRNLELFGGISPKDVTTWNDLLPSDTLLRHQLGRLYPIANETLAFGSFINLHNNAGVINARKANAASGLVKPAHGYCSQAGGITAGNRGEIILSQGLLGIGGVSPGAPIYLSTTPGVATLVAPTGAGQLEQFLGIAVATDIVYIDISLGQYIQH